MKKKLSNIEFMRAICAIGIVIYHFSHYSFCERKIFLDYPTGRWGEALVIVFLALSGGLLYLNNTSITSLKTFYIKRFKTLFPMFYLSFGFFFLMNVLNSKRFFYRDDCSPWTLIFSILGMDGYFRFAYVNYYILGEWFLGAIIIAYLLYPLLLLGLNKLPIITTVIVFSSFALLMINCSMNYPYQLPVKPETFIIGPLLHMDAFRHPVSIIFCFYLGMLLFKYKEILESNVLFLIGLAGILLLALVPLNIVPALSQHLMGYCIFFVLYKVGQFVCKIKLLEQISLFFGKISYPIFLLQAFFVQYMLSIKNPIDTVGMLKWLGVTILTISFFAYILYFIAKLITRSKRTR